MDPRISLRIWLESSLSSTINMISFCICYPGPQRHRKAWAAPADCKLCRIIEHEDAARQRLNLAGGPKCETQIGVARRKHNCVPVFREMCTERVTIPQNQQLLRPTLVTCHECILSLQELNPLSDLIQIPSCSNARPDTF